MSANAWANNGQTSRGAPHDEVNTLTFNAQEVRDCLRQAFRTLNAQEARFITYKPAGQTNSARPGGPWSSKGGAMGNNRDFMHELRKQVTTMQQGERAGG